MNAKKQVKALFLTYNSVGRNLANGWHDLGHQSIQNNSQHSVLLLQGFIRKDQSGPDIAQKRNALVKLWREACASTDLRAIDFFAIYCGKIPDLAINLAAGLDPAKVVFFHCGCGWIEDYHYGDFLMHHAVWVNTACGGIDEMQRALQLFQGCGILTFEAQTLKDALQSLKTAREIQQLASR